MKEQKLNKDLHIFLTEIQHKRLKKLAYKKGTSMGALVRKFIDTQIFIDWCVTNLE